MQLALNELELPIRLRVTRPLDDAELARFCSENTFATICPEFVVEVRSDSDRLRDLR